MIENAMKILQTFHLTIIHLLSKIFALIKKEYRDESTIFIAIKQAKCLKTSLQKQQNKGYKEIQSIIHLKMSVFSIISFYL